MIALILSIYFLFPFGELFRFDPGYGFIIKPIDILIVIVSIVFLGNQLFLRKIPKETLSKPFLLFVSFALVSLLMNLTWLSFSNFLIACMYLIRFASIGSLYIIISRFSQKQKGLLSVVMIVSGFLVALFGFIQYILYTNLINLSYLGWDNHWFRLFSTFFDPNFVGAFLVLFFLYILFFTISAFSQKNIYKTSLYVFLSLSSLLAIFLTFSRAALLSLIVGILLFVFLQKKRRWIAITILICFFIGIGTILLNYQKTEGTKLFRVASSTARIASAQNALLIVTKSPIIGIGFDAYRYAQLRFNIATGPNWKTSHSGAGTDNSFLFVLATTGILGFLLYLHLFKTIFFLCMKSLRTNPFALVVLASFCSIIVNSFFINSLFYPFILIWLVSLLGIIEKSEQ